MKYSLLFVMVMVLMTSCKQKRDISFDYIDISIGRDRAQEYYSLKILQNGKAYIKSYPNTNYAIILNKYTIDTISLLTETIMTSDLDSVYYTDCLNCMNFKLIIKTKDNRQQFFHVGDFNINEKFRVLENYVGYLNKIIDKSIDSADSLFNFESWTDNLLPPPPPEIENKQEE